MPGYILYHKIGSTVIYVFEFSTTWLPITARTRYKLKAVVMKIELKKNENEGNHQNLERRLSPFSNHLGVSAWRCGAGRIRSWSVSGSWSARRRPSDCHPGRPLARWPGAGRSRRSSKRGPANAARHPAGIRRTCRTPCGPSRCSLGGPAFRKVDDRRQIDELESQVWRVRRGKRLSNPSVTLEEVTEERSEVGHRNKRQVTGGYLANISFPDCFPTSTNIQLLTPNFTDSRKNAVSSKSWTLKPNMCRLLRWPKMSENSRSLTKTEARHAHACAQCTHTSRKYR